MPQNVTQTDVTEVYTDGACQRNPGGPGGWGWVVDETTFGLGGEPSTTNQRMEISAALEACRALADRPGLVVFSDSTYVVNCLTKGWHRTWTSNGWLNSSKQPVANRDLWEPLIELADQRVEFRWVKGHSGVALNEVADRLANAGMLGTEVTAPLDLAATVTAASGPRFQVKARWSAACKACGERYAVGAGVTKSDLGWVHVECAEG